MILLLFSFVFSIFSNTPRLLVIAFWRKKKVHIKNELNSLNRPVQKSDKVLLRYLELLSLRA